MKRVNLLMDEAMFYNLKLLPEGISESIRRAVYEYLLKLASFKVSASESKKGGK